MVKLNIEHYFSLVQYYFQFGIFHLIFVNSVNEFKENETDNKLPLEPIPDNLLVSVRNINKKFNDKGEFLSICFNMESLCKHCQEQSKLEAKITCRYASKPLTRDYFTAESVIYIKEMLELI